MTFVTFMTFVTSKNFFKKLAKHSKTAMGMLYLCSIEKQRTKHRSAMHQGARWEAPKMQNTKCKIQNAKYKI